MLAGVPDFETCLGCAESETLELTDEVIAFAPLHQAPWGVIVRQMRSELMAPVNRLLVQTLLLGIGTVLGALLLVWVTTNSVIQPVQLLKEASERIAKGDLSTPIELPPQTWVYGGGRRRDEIGIWQKASPPCAGSSNARWMRLTPLIVNWTRVSRNEPRLRWRLSSTPRPPEMTCVRSSMP